MDGTPVDGTSVTAAATARSRFTQEGDTAGQHGDITRGFHNWTLVMLFEAVIYITVSSVYV